MFKCLICGAPVSIRFPLCHVCNKKHPYHLWENWLAEIWKDEKKFRYRAMQIKKHEKTFSECSYDEISEVGLK